MIRRAKDTSQWLPSQIERGWQFKNHIFLKLCGYTSSERFSRSRNVLQAQGIVGGQQEGVGVGGVSKAVKVTDLYAREEIQRTFQTWCGYLQGSSRNLEPYFCSVKKLYAKKYKNCMISTENLRHSSSIFQARTIIRERSDSQKLLMK